MALRDVLHPDPARLAVFGQLDGTGDEHLSHRAAPALRPIHGIMPGPERHLRFIDLNKVFQWIAIRTDHRPPELEQQEPSCLVTAEAELRLKLQR